MMNTIPFDPDGDLTLVVGQDPSKADCSVCSRTLSRASVVFKRMLNGGFLESKPTDGSPWVVNLPEDDPVAAQVLFAIVHSRFDLFCNTTDPPPKKNLYSILVFAEKYDLTKFVQPWAQSWMPSLHRFSTSNDYSSLIGIAWELGAESELELVVRRMISECGACPETGQLTGHKTKVLEYEGLPLIPHGLLDSIADVRERILHMAFSEIQTDIKLLRAAVVCDTFNHGLCRVRDDEALLCNTLTFGTYMAAFKQAELRSISAGGTNVGVGYPWSIRHLISVVSESRRDVGIDGHEECRTVGSDRADYILDLLSPDNGLTKVLSEKHRGYLKKQQRKLGVLKAVELD